MMCPHCGQYLTKRQIVRVNIKGYGNADIVYDAVCPYCRARMGRMFWGRLIPDNEAAPVPAPDAPIQRQCPHCGRPLPHDLDSLPVVRGSGDRRAGADRRRVQMPWTRPERRRADRRAADERRVPPPPAAPPVPMPPDQRQGERRRNQRPVLYDRRKAGSDRRRAPAVGLELKRKV